MKKLDLQNWQLLEGVQGSLFWSRSKSRTRKISQHRASVQKKQEANVIQKTGS